MLSPRVHKLLAALISLVASFLFFELSQAAFFENTTAYFGIFSLQDTSLMQDRTVMLTTLGASLLYILYSYLSAISLQITLSIGRALSYDGMNRRISIAAAIGAAFMGIAAISLLTCLFDPTRAIASRILYWLLFPITYVRLPSLVGILSGILTYPWLVVHWMKYAHI